jgi:hypothetical protein
MSQSMVIESNASSVSDVRVSDLGTDVPSGGGSITLADRDDLLDASLSNALRVLTSDNAFGAGQHSLIIRDPVNAIAVSDVDAFLSNLTTVQGSAPYEIFGAGVGGSIGDPTDYAGRFEGATIGTGDIPLNKWGWWYDTVNSRLLAVRNRSNVLYFVEPTL